MLKKRLVSLAAACLLAIAALAATAMAAETYTTTTRVKFRAGPSLEAAVIRILDTGASVEVEEYDAENWSKVVVGGVAGYIKSEYLVSAYAVEPAAVTTTMATAAADEPAAVESEPTPDAPDAPEGAGEGAGAAYKTTTRVNFRTGPSLEADVIKTLGQGITLEVLAYDAAEWSTVMVDGVTGYVKSEYIISADQYSAKRGDVELLEWSAVKSMLPLHRPLTVTDVRSGVTYTVQSFSNGLHADVEPLTKDDTAALLQTYGGKWKWDPRPVWVTFNGRTFAASINGMPHGGGTIAGNGMNGQVCLHFLGSRPHNGNKAFERDHQAGVMEAFNAAK